MESIKKTTLHLLFVALAILAFQTACTKSAKEPAPVASGYLIRLKPLKNPIDFRVKREERTLKTSQPQYASNHDLSFDANIKKDSDSTYIFTVSNVVGIDLDKTQTAHFQRIAKAIEQQRLMRTFNEIGPTSDLEFVNHNPAGWAGMMTARTLGRYEHGFLEVHFSKDRVEVGGTWKLPNDLAKETNHGLTADTSTDDFYEKTKVVQKGGDVKYTLVKIEQKGDQEIGEITFKSIGEVVLSFDSKVLGLSTTKYLISETGTIWIDMDTGWPIRAKIIRRNELLGEEGTRVEEHTTNYERF